MVTIGGFDTHANQLDTHQELLTQVSTAVSAFYQDLAATGHDQNVLSMTFSEFGRRVYENGSSGTDHGKAAPSLLFGPALNGNGFAGIHPDLDNDITNNGNIEYTTDFRQLYSTILSQWLCAEASSVEVSLNGAFENMDLGFDCENVGVDDPTDDPIDDPAIVQSPMSTYSYFENNDTIIRINSDAEQQVEVKLFSIIGQSIGYLYNNILPSGESMINVNELYPNLSTGNYIYSVSSSNYAESKKIVIRRG